MFGKKAPKKEKQEEKQEQIHEDALLNLQNEYDPENPYAIGRKEFDDQYTRLAKNAAAWRRIAFLMLVLLAGSVVYILYWAQEVKVVPYVVQVDQFGYQLVIRPADRTNPVDDRIIMARLSDFIINMRSIYSDPEVLSYMLSATYNSVQQDSEAYGKLNDYFRLHNPMMTPNTLVDVKLNMITRTAPDANDMWNAEWTELTYSGGELKGTKYYQGVFRLDFVPPSRMEDIMRNPMGVFVRNFLITERLRPQEMNAD